MVASLEAGCIKMIGVPLPPVSQYHRRASATWAKASLAGTCAGMGRGRIGLAMGAGAAPPPVGSRAPAANTPEPCSRWRRFTPGLESNPRGDKLWPFPVFEFGPVLLRNSIQAQGCDAMAAGKNVR